MNNRGEIELKRIYALIKIICILTCFIISCENPSDSSELETGTLTDIDGNVYQTVKIGNQWWMVENLKVTHYRNGDAIPNLTSDSEWGGISTGAYCAYDNDENNVNIYGYLYNWFTVDDDRNIAPEGWHVPTDEEWKELEMFLGMSRVEADSAGMRGIDIGGKLKETGTTHWNRPNNGATNESLFTARPGGRRGGVGFFFWLGEGAYFWSSTEYNNAEAWYRRLDNYLSDIWRETYEKNYGLSIRLVRD